MKIGLIARAEDRGLGLQSWEFARHLNPNVLLIEFGDNPSFPSHRDRYPGATVVRFHNRLPAGVVKRWLAGLDVVYSAETFYDPTFPRLAAAAGVTPVLHINPEFFRGQHPETRCWAPTAWRLDHLPSRTEVVPVPVALDRWPTPVEPHNGPCRWLHVAGKAALADRNGTDIVLAAARRLQRPCHLTIVSQDARVAVPAVPPHVELSVVPSVPNYWELYADHDALVMPRRYGGLCLPVQEAMGAGLAVLMSDCPPNPQTWPTAHVRAVSGPHESMPTGLVPIHTVTPADLARAMDAFDEPEIRHCWQANARRWAAEHSWDVWADRYRALFAEQPDTM